jgi:hypothetical protein
VKPRSPDFEDDIPLGHAIFLVREDVRGAVIIHELTSFQVDGKLYDVRKLDEDFLDDELLSSLDKLQRFLKDKPDEEWPS